MPVDAGKGCSHPDSADLTKVSCTVTTLDSQSPYRVLRLELGDGDDEATDTGGVNANFVSGREGNDTISLGEGGVAFGHEGDDLLYGEEGGGPGSDRLSGGPGTDVVEQG